MRIVVLGCDHSMQPKDHPGGWQIESERKIFRDAVEDFIQRYTVTYIGEEPKFDCPTSTEELAKKCGVRYHRIDIPKEIQESIHTRWYAPDEECQSDYWRAYQLVREWHMYVDFCNELKDATAAMLVCGRWHAPAFTNLFTNRFGAEVVSACLRLRHFAECNDCCERSKSPLPY